MRVAIVDPFFVEEAGYQTTGYFNAFVADGHQVRAICSEYIIGVFRQICGSRTYPPGLSKYRGGEVQRLPGRLMPRDIVKCPGVLQAVCDFAPDLTLAIYPGTMFAGPLFHGCAHLPGALFTAYGDNRAQRRVAVPSLRNSIKRAVVDLGFHFVKRRHYRRTIEVSDATLMQTPDTMDYVLGRIARGRRRQKLRSKCALSFLGFDSAVLYLDPEDRNAERSRLGLSHHDVVCVYSCKITPVKKLDIWVTLMASAMRRVESLKAMLIGIQSGHPESERVASLIRDTGMADRFICLPFAERGQLCSLYNAADFGIWYHQPSVSIQESMGTGLYMLLTDEPTVSHLLIEPITGRYFSSGNIDEALALIVQTARAFHDEAAFADTESRKQRAIANADRFSYLSLVRRLVAAAGDLPAAVRLATLPENAVQTSVSRSAS